MLLQALRLALRMLQAHQSTQGHQSARRSSRPPARCSQHTSLINHNPSHHLPRCNRDDHRQPIMVATTLRHHRRSVAALPFVAPEMMTDAQALSTMAMELTDHQVHLVEGTETTRIVQPVLAVVLATIVTTMTMIARDHTQVIDAAEMVAIAQMIAIETMIAIEIMIVSETMTETATMTATTTTTTAAIAVAIERAILTCRDFARRPRPQTAHIPEKAGAAAVATILRQTRIRADVIADRHRSKRVSRPSRKRPRVCMADDTRR